MGLTLAKVNVRMLLHSIHEGDSAAISKRLINSLEQSLNNRLATILNIKKQLLSQGALGSLMSGSGSSVFGIFSSQTRAKTAAAFLRRAHKSWKVFVVSTL